MLNCEVLRVHLVVQVAVILGVLNSCVFSGIIVIVFFVSFNCCCCQLLKLAEYRGRYLAVFPAKLDYLGFCLLFASFPEAHELS